MNIFLDTMYKWRSFPTFIKWKMNLYNAVKNITPKQLHDNGNVVTIQMTPYHQVYSIKIQKV